MEKKITQILKKLVQTYSLSGQEERISKMVDRILKDRGFNPVKDGSNIYLRLKGVDSNKTLIFNAHLDTVDAGDKKLWKYPPFGKNAGIVENGKLYGLGASDAKASITALILLSEEFKRQKPPIDVWLTFVVKEEVDGSGTKQFIQWFKADGYCDKYKEINSCLGEPTNLEKVEIGHRGDTFLRIKTYGDTGHSSRPNEIQRQAIWEMFSVLSKLIEFSSLVAEADRFKDKFFPPSTLCVTAVNTPKGAMNKVPSSCEVILDVRTTPKLEESLVIELKECLKDYKVQISHLKKSSKSIKTDISARIVSAIRQVVPQVEMVAAKGSNDMGSFVRNNIPAIVFGPGIKEVIHKENEFAEIHKIVECVEIYNKLIYSI